MNDSQNRIWRPAVNPNDNPMPTPGSQMNQQQTYTKTSLTATDYSGDSSSKFIKRLNRDILSASQAYNNSPKPFTRQASQQPTTSTLDTANLASVRETSVSGQQQVASYSQQRASSLCDSSSVQSHHQQIQNRPQRQTQDAQGENMAPKLVHKQYNSPIDLYSMNNIRKTIEAHTEIIAPGVKGINFMKPETPINKQSEVYKLVMEEEQRDRQRDSMRLSPISGQPVNIPTGLVESAKSMNLLSNDVAHHAHLTAINEHSGLQQRTSTSAHQHINQSSLNQEQHTQQARYVEGQPSCCECGRHIVGPFAKVQNRFVHPQCFNCTTCGTSLKNTGYFTVNEKFYCEIHAKQMAKMMRIQYNFAEKQSVSANQPEQTHQQQQQQGTQQVAAAIREQTELSSGLKQVHRQSSNIRASSPATISTMFADRSQVASTEREEVRWTWRPATNEECHASDTRQTVSSLHHQQEVQPLPSSSFLKQQQQQQQHHQQQQQQTTLSVGARGHGLMQENKLVGGRVPICCHCQAQVQGPYILAGKTTWCKQCSQIHFNCSSCRRSLLDIGFIEDSSRKYYCENCFEAYFAPVCSKCNIKIKGDCLNALGKQWHPSCFICGHCHRPFGNSSFYLEDNVPYCERDWKILFTTRCYSCSMPIEAGDKWIEALSRSYHSNCFKCTSCFANLEGSTFYCKGGKPYCRLHAK